MVEKSASVPLLTTSSLCSELCAGIIAQAGPKKATAREYNSLWARKLQTGLILHTHYGDPESESSCSTRRSSPMRRECINTCRSPTPGAWLWPIPARIGGSSSRLSQRGQHQAIPGRSA